MLQGKQVNAIYKFIGKESEFVVSLFYLNHDETAKLLTDCLIH